MEKDKDGIFIHKNNDYDYNLLITQDHDTPHAGVQAYPTLSDFLE